MGAAASKKRRRRAAEAQQTAEAEAEPALEALEETSAAPFVPPRGVTLALLAVTLGGAAYFAAQGVEAARLSEGRLAATLLRVETKDEPPQRFELKSLEGETVSLSAYDGKVVFLNFWATWCPPCVEEMPSMRRLREKLADDDRFVMLAVSADDEWAPVKKFFRGETPPFSVLLDPGGDLAKQYGTEKFPETYVLVDGRLVGYIVGPRDWDTWYAEAYLRALLGERAG